MGLGLWLIGTAIQHPLIAALGLTGGLLHVCNHAIFKSLLFLGAGTVKHATHTLNIDQLGGLLKKMPKTALAFLVGIVSICGIPPFNGFISEFLIYLAGYTIISDTTAPGHAITSGIIALISLALIGGLAATCFVKVFGIMFLGSPRSDNAAQANEPSPAMWFPMMVMAVSCILIGTASPFCIRIILPAARPLLHFQVSGLPEIVFPLLLPICLTAGIFFLCIISLVFLRRRIIGRQTVNSGPTWDCGYAVPSARMQYTASSFAQPVVNMFRWIVRPHCHIHMHDSDFPERMALSTHTDDLFKRYLFKPLFRISETIATFLHRLQQGRNQLYILYIAITIIALLIFNVR